MGESYHIMENSVNVLAFASNTNVHRITFTRLISTGKSIVDVSMRIYPRLKNPVELVILACIYPAFMV
jgi:2-phospho-L-lactate transferase/gluconeogenesis factor (CofD/UPF0052 family)